GFAATTATLSPAAATDGNPSLENATNDTRTGRPLGGAVRLLEHPDAAATVRPQIQRVRRMGFPPRRWQRTQAADPHHNDGGAALGLPGRRDYCTVIGPDPSSIYAALPPLIRLSTTRAESVPAGTAWTTRRIGNG